MATVDLAQNGKLASAPSASLADRADGLPTMAEVA